MCKKSCERKCVNDPPKGEKEQKEKKCLKVPPQGEGKKAEKYAKEPKIYNSPSKIYETCRNIPAKKKLAYKNPKNMQKPPQKCAKKC